MTERPILYVAIDEANDKITFLTTELENLKAALALKDEVVKRLKELVRAMGKIVYGQASQAKYNKTYDLNFCADCGEEWGYGHKKGCKVGKAQQILEMPEVKAIMEPPQMPTKAEWLTKAQAHDLAAREYYRKDNITMARVYESRADAAREMACLAAAREDSK